MLINGIQIKDPLTVSSFVNIKSNSNNSIASKFYLDFALLDSRSASMPMLFIERITHYNHNIVLSHIPEHWQQAGK